MARKYILRQWMSYSPSKSALFCFCCRSFARGTKSKFNSPDGFRKWWKLNPKVREHEASLIHQDALTKWQELRMRLAANRTIDATRSSNIITEIEKSTAVLERIVDIVKYLAKQNLAFRGHRESGQLETRYHGEANTGNFLELVHLLAKYDPVLREHVVRLNLSTRRKTSYMSNKTQNKFINALGELVRNNILEQVKLAKYFSMIFDSTPDSSRKDQTSQVLRYVIVGESGVKVVESFVGFIETQRKDSAGITEMILARLESNNLDIQNCRGQAYDDAAVMSGQRS